MREQYEATVYSAGQQDVHGPRVAIKFATEAQRNEFVKAMIDCDASSRDMFETYSGNPGVVYIKASKGIGTAGTYLSKNGGLSVNFGSTKLQERFTTFLGLRGKELVDGPALYFDNRRLPARPDGKSSLKIIPENANITDMKVLTSLLVEEVGLRVNAMNYHQTKAGAEAFKKDQERYALQLLATPKYGALSKSMQRDKPGAVSRIFSKMEIPSKAQKEVVKPISQQKAAAILNTYGESLARLEKKIRATPTHLLRSDFQYIPNFLGALTAIRDNTKFTPNVATSGMSAFKSLPDDPSVCVHKLLEDKHFTEMVAHYCKDDTELAAKLNGFTQAVKTKSTVLETTLSEVVGDKGKEGLEQLVGDIAKKSGKTGEKLAQALEDTKAPADPKVKAACGIIKKAAGKLAKDLENMPEQANKKDLLKLVAGFFKTIAVEISKQCGDSFKSVSMALGSFGQAMDIGIRDRSRIGVTKTHLPSKSKDTGRGL